MGLFSSRLRGPAAACLFILLAGMGPVRSQELVVEPASPVLPVLPVNAPASLSVGPVFAPIAPLPALQGLGASLSGLNALPGGSGFGFLGRIFDGLRLRGPRPAPLPLPPAPFIPIPPAPRIQFYGRSFKTYLFSREEPIEDAIVAAIDLVPAGGTLDLALHGINLDNATAAILRAHQRGVRVRIVMNWTHVFPERRGHVRSPQIDQLLQAGVDMRALKGSGPYGVMHSKFALLNGQVVEFGSFNWSKAANTMNLENARFQDDPELIAAFNADWRWMWDQATPVGGGTPQPADPNGIPRDQGLVLRFKGQPWPKYAFSPNGGVAGWILRGIGMLAAGEAIDVADFGFYSQDIADALLEAKDRGVLVRIVMDRSQAASSPLARFFTEHGFDFRLSVGRGGPSGPGVMHHKFILFNHELLEDGSYNLSPNAELHNFENAIWFTEAPDLAGFQAEFENLYARAQAPSLQDTQGFPLWTPGLPGFMGHEDLPPQ